MRQSRFTDSQVMEALKRAEAGVAVPEICREMGISSATFYKWRAKYGGMDTLMISRMKDSNWRTLSSRRCMPRNAIDANPIDLSRGRLTLPKKDAAPYSY